MDVDAVDLDVGTLFLFFFFRCFLCFLFDDGLTMSDFVFFLGFVDVDGLVTLAGRAEPGATIEVLVGETLIGTISVGQDGSFASIF